MERLVGQLIGGLIITFLLSRLFLWMLRRLLTPSTRILVAHAATLAVCWLIYAFGSSQGDGPHWLAGILYLPPVIFWLVVDLIRQLRRGERIDEISN